jgi:hypothetical protein
MGAQGRPTIWHLTSLLFKLFQPSTGLANVLEGTYPNCRYFSGKFFHLWKIWVYQHHTFYYSSDLLVLVIGWHPGQLPGWPAS